MHAHTVTRLGSLALLGALAACGGGNTSGAEPELAIPSLVKKNGFPTGQQDQALPLLTPTTLFTTGGKVAETFEVFLEPENQELIDLLATVGVDRLSIGTLGDTFEPPGVLEVDADDDGPINIVGELLLRDLGLPLIPASWRVVIETDAQIDGAEGLRVVSSGYSIDDVTLPISLEAPQFAVSLDALLPTLPNLFAGSAVSLTIDGIPLANLSSADGLELSGAVIPELVEIPGTLTVSADVSSFVNADLGIVTLTDETSVELPNLSPGRHWSSATEIDSGDGTVPLLPYWTLTTGEVEDEVFVFREATGGAVPRGELDAMVPGRTRFFRTQNDDSLTEIFPGVFVPGTGDDGEVEAVDGDVGLIVGEEGAAIVPVFFTGNGFPVNLGNVFANDDLDAPDYVPPAALRVLSEGDDGTFPSLLTVQPILRGDLGQVNAPGGGLLWPDGIGAIVRLADGLRLDHDPALLAEFVIEPLGFGTEEVVDVTFVVQANDGVAWTDLERVSLGAGALDHATTALAGLPIGTPVRFWALIDLLIGEGEEAENVLICTERYDTFITRSAPTP